MKKYEKNQLYSCKSRFFEDFDFIWLFKFNDPLQIVREKKYKKILFYFWNDI